MKRMVTITTVLLLAVSFLIVGSKRAEAMHNDGVKVLAGLTIVFGQPFVNAGAHDVVYAGPAYAPAYPTRYIERTKIIYGKPRHFMHRHRGWGHGKIYPDERRRQEYRHDRDEVSRDHRGSAH